MEDLRALAFRRHYGDVYRFVRRHTDTDDTAEEIAQSSSRRRRRGSIQTGTGRHLFSPGYTRSLNAASSMPRVYGRGGERCSRWRSPTHQLLARSPPVSRVLADGAMAEIAEAAGNKDEALRYFKLALAARTAIRADS